MQKYPLQIVGNIGLFYACYKLSTLGWNAMPTSRNARGIDLICFSMNGHKMLSFQVKSLSKRHPVPLGTDLESTMGDFWISINNIASAGPDAYVLLPHEVKALAVRRERNGKVSYWLQPKQYCVAAFHESWSRTGYGF